MTIRREGTATCIIASALSKVSDRPNEHAHDIATLLAAFARQGQLQRVAENHHFYNGIVIRSSSFFFH